MNKIRFRQFNYRFIFLFIFVISYPIASNGQSFINNNQLDLNWLNSFKVNENTWVLKKSNITCYSGRVLYPFGPECADSELSKDLTRSPAINLGFNLTFMGHKFDKAYVNQHGMISFQESFLGQTLSQDDWPNPKYPYVDDPVFIAPFYAQTDLASDKTEDLTQTKYGRVLYKVMHRSDLPQIYTEEEKFVYQMSMKILDEAQKQIRESVAGGEDFIATHALIATWKSVTFLGNSISNIDERPRNTFQATILTDTNYTFAVFNYEDVNWYASTTQGGNPETGTGGKAAKVGFNRGNGTLWYGNRPFSENAQLMQSLSNYSNVAIPGRFIFRIDEWIQPAGCLNLDFEEEKILKIWPRSGIMLGGQEVNVTGPCYPDSPYFLCKWGDWYDAQITVGETTVVGLYLSKIRARCIQPTIFFNGRLNLSISLDGGRSYIWRAEYTIVDPLRYPAKVEMVNLEEWHQRDTPSRLILNWNRFDLSPFESDQIDIELWGYYEDDQGPHWDLLQLIGDNKINKGSFGFDVAPNRARNITAAKTYKMGAIAVTLFDAHYSDPRLISSKKIWSALHPLGWWRNDEMKFYYDKQSFLFGNSRGKNWAEDQCRWWHQYRRNDRYWMDDLEICPPTLLFAIGDAGVWAPDPSCNMYGDEYNSLNCLQHMGASHCVITMRRTAYGSGNRCCYDKAGNLMYTNDTSSGSTPDRYHSLGMPPYNTYGKVPGLSHYFHDIVPYYLCCRWSNQCDAYLYLRQTKDAKGYREPRMAVAYGDPHLITFDGKDYTFNGKGEFTLFRSKRYNFRLQGRFEQPPNATFCLLSSKGQINATRITAISVGQDDSDFVEVRARVFPTQTFRVNCDVLVNGKTYYFNYTEEKVQLFKNVYILSPLNDLYQSNITIMFNSSGVGVQVECAYGIIHVRASAPYLMFKETSGLFGYWDNITANDFMSPDGSTNQLTLKPDLLYQRFGMAWRLKDESESIFTYSGSWNFDTFHDNRPMIKEWQRFRPWFTHTEVPFPSNVSFSMDEWKETCEGDEQCLYDAAAMGSLSIGERTRDSHRYYRLLHESMKSVNSCGIYLLKGGIRETTKGNYLAGSIMTVSCEKGYILFGWNKFYCNWNGTWLPTNNQWLGQFRDWPYCEHYHITAIRWTAIGISIIWALCLIGALVYYFFFKKQKEYVTGKSNEKEAEDEYFDFKAPEDENEIAAFGILEEKNYFKDGMVPALKVVGVLANQTAENTDDEENQLYRTPSEEVLAAQLEPVDRLQKPYILIQVPGSNNNNQQEPELNQQNEEKPSESQNIASFRPNNTNNSNRFVPNNEYVNQMQENEFQRETNQQQQQQQPQNNRNQLNQNQNENENDVDYSNNQIRLLQQKQLENPYLKKMRELKEQQQKQIRLQFENQQENQINNANQDDLR